MRFFGKGVTALVDEKLKDEMTKAYEDGEYDKALPSLEVNTINL